MLCAMCKTGRGPLEPAILVVAGAGAAESPGAQWPARPVKELPELAGPPPVPPAVTRLGGCCALLQCVWLGDPGAASLAPLPTTSVRPAEASLSMEVRENAPFASISPMPEVRDRPEVLKEAKRGGSRLRGPLLEATAARSNSPPAVCSFADEVLMASKVGTAVAASGCSTPALWTPAVLLAPALLRPWLGSRGAPAPERLPDRGSCL